VDLLDAAVDGRLDRARADWDGRPAVGVVMAAGGYPGTPRKNDEIHGLDAAPPAGTKVFHAGTALSGGKVVTSGGRVLCVCAIDKSVRVAQHRAYETVAKISWDGEQHRTDIGYRAIARE
jgi:phosphoribosylamine--glycine ligase